MKYEEISIDPHKGLVNAAIIVNRRLGGSVIDIQLLQNEAKWNCQTQLWLPFAISCFGLFSYLYLYECRL